MKILINTTVLVKGGGIQVAKSILEEIRENPENEYFVFLSPNVAEEIKKISFNGNFHFYTFPISPSKIFSRKRVLRDFSRLEKEISPDLVYTVFGPSYWRPKTVHVCGYADGWCYNPDTIAFSNLGLKDRIKKKLLIKYKNYYIKRTTDYLVVETEVAKKNIIKFLSYDEKKVYVVGNTASRVYDQFPITENNTQKSTYSLFTLSAYYSSKNLDIINEVTKILKKRTSSNFRFYLTIKDDVFKEKFGENDSVLNLGPQPIEEGPRLYSKYDALFLPTLLETFSASYPEAMKMQRPIITSDLDFARDVCKDAAVYFDPLDPEDIADKIIATFVPEIRSRIVEAGKRRILDFETSKSRKDKYLEIFKIVLKENH